MRTLRSRRTQSWSAALATLVAVVGVLVAGPASASNLPLPASVISTATAPLGGAGNSSGDTVTFTSPSGTTGTATFASSVSDFATVGSGSLTFLTPILATANGAGTGVNPANAGDALVIWNSGTTSSPTYSYFDATTESPAGSGAAFVGFSLTNSGGTVKVCVTGSGCDQNNTATDLVYGRPSLMYEVPGSSGWTLAPAITESATVETTGGSLGTGSYSLTISYPGPASSGTGTGTGTSGGSPLPAANVATTAAASPGVGNVVGDTVAFTSSSGIAGTATYASSISDFATVTEGLINVSLPFVASASATGSGTTPANAGDALGVWNSGTASSPLYTYVDVTSQSATTDVNGGMVGFSFINPGGSTSMTAFESIIAGGTAGAQSGWTTDIAVPPSDLTIFTTGGTLGTGSYGETISTAGFSGGTGTGTGSGTGLSSSISVAAQSGVIGQALALQVLGTVSGGLSVTYSVSNGTATGCSITGGNLVANTAGTCMVVATEVAPGNVTIATSSATPISFALPAKPGAITAGFAAKASILSAASKSALVALAKKLIPGATVVVTGFARANASLARRRALAAANFLRNKVSIKVIVKIVTKSSQNKDTVTTLRQ